jgi:hypothetical protein
MASQMVSKIKAAADHVWPEVSRALQLTTLRVADLADVTEVAVEQVEAYITGHERGTWKRRAIATETVWALARVGRLRTGEEAAIVQAALGLVDGLLKDIPEGDLEPEETALIQAVRALPSWEA